MLNYITLANKRIWNNKYLGEQSMNLLDKTFIIPKNFEFEILEVTEKYVARPDILSYDAYGDDMYADIICKVNGISNPFELNVGKLVIIPDINDLYKFVNNEDISEPIDELKGNVLPQPKLRNQKRKANEAVVGDKRYRIDSSNKIIIY